MMELVIGGGGSGKSAYAEQAVASLTKDGMKRYYLATMRVLDEEGQKRVARHKKLRAGKGFRVIEQPVRIQGALEKMETPGCAVLLECVSNLMANEMFTQEGVLEEAQAVDAVVNGILLLRDNVTHFIVVSNNVFEDGIRYDEATMKYIRAMGRANRLLAAAAQRVVEVVAGEPVRIK